jgi:predicted nucleic acid-binding protein
MSDRAFIDTNVFVYLNSADNPGKREVAKKIINSYDCVVSTQVANELSNVLLRKYGRSIPEIKQTVAALTAVCDVAVITIATTEKALDLHERYCFSFYDSLILASAIENGCKYVISEDLHENTSIDGDLRILNVFDKGK